MTVYEIGEWYREQVSNSRSSTDKHETLNSIDQEQRESMYESLMGYGFKPIKDYQTPQPLPTPNGDEPLRVKDLIPLLEKVSGPALAERVIRHLKAI